MEMGLEVEKTINPLKSSAYSAKKDEEKSSLHRMTTVFSEPQTELMPIPWRTINRI